MTDDNLFPLSLPQEAFYYDYLLHRNDCKYIMGGALILNGDLNIELYQKAYNYVIEHFDIMRAEFVKKGEQLFQRFRPEYKCVIQYLDFRDYSSPVEKALEHMVAEFHKPVPMESSDLYSESILQTAEKQFFFAPKFHHMINDATGRAIINQLVSDTYNHLLEKGSYPELKPHSYKDFLEDDLRYRGSDVYNKSFEYWKQKFSRLPEPFSFTMKKKSIRNISLHSERLTLNMHRVCFESILNIAYETGATTFQVILGLIAVSLCRCYDRNDLIIGMPVLNRSNHKFRNTPGLFLNTIGLRISVDPEGTFNQLIGSIKSEVRECYRHQRFPLKEIIKHLRTSNPEFNNELFDVTVNYRKNDYSQQLGEEKLNSITFETGIRSESLSIEIDEYDEEGNVNIFFGYNPQLFTSDEITWFVNSFETILMDLVHFPEKKIKELQTLNEFDTHKILTGFNSADDNIVTGKTITEMFAEAVEKWPHEAALISDNEVISYKELNERANRIAGYLLNNYKISREEIICLSAERSVEAIAAILGIMKAGAACLPVDNEYPAERVKYIIENSGARILIESSSKRNTSDSKRDPLAEAVIQLNEISWQNTIEAGVKTRPSDLAYVIYTSGSTGKPKGVMIEHGQFMSMFVNMIGKFAVKNTDRVLHFASLGFDASIFEIFQALLTGAALVIADKETVRNPEAFIRYVEDKKVTVATLPPVYLRALNKAELPFIHTLITAGEQANASDVNFYKQFKRFINAYGPTEASVCASYYIASKEKEYSGRVPIGRPSPNAKIYILDKNLKPVAIGFPGELCISGPSLARGYLSNDELSAQKFINNPFEEGTRLYRTGDLARWSADGNIEFLGRADDQLKIKGNRIEPGEIEARLAKYDNIKEVTVLDLRRGEEKELAAFITSSLPVEIKDLKYYLRKFLPEYMIPLHYVFIDEIPLTQNGKVDKEALRRMPLNSRSDKKEYSAASGEIETSLAAMFEEILEVRPVGIDDNFFELGGESLKIARLISKIHKELKREISFKVIFDNPTVRGIAAQLEAGARRDYGEIPISGEKEYYTLSHAQKRLWILSQNKENAAVYHMPVSLLLEGELNQNALEESLRKIVHRHESLRTVFVEMNGIPYQKVMNEYSLDIPEHDLSEKENINDALKKLTRERILSPFELACDVPFRAEIIKLEKEKHVLLLVIHHIAGDGISVGIIMRELAGYYNSIIQGGPYEPQALRIQYKDYCGYEKELIESNKYTEEKQYWIKKLHQPLPTLELPYDRPRPPVKTYNGDYLFFEIEPELSKSLSGFCRQQGVSLYVLVVSVVNILLHKYSSQDDIILGSPVSGRNHPDLEDQVGVYINTVALRNRINNLESYTGFLKDVKNNSTEAIARSNYPFDRLIQDLKLDRDTSRTPVFDVLVQLQSENPAFIKLNGIKSSFYEAEFRLNKFDLTFTFVEEGNQIKFSIGYNTDLFSNARIDNAARHLKNIIKYVLKHPDHLIQDICLLDEAELNALETIYSGNSREFNRALTIPELFESQARKTPQRTALIFRDEKYTFKELDELANNLANEIKMRFSLKPDDVIGIMTERSGLMIIGILGILKAGAAYMPVEADYPAERISFMLQDSKSKILITETGLLNKAHLAAGLNKTEHNIKTDILDINSVHGHSAQRPPLEITSSNLAYVIYTSGSTGKPKGVMIEHGSLHNLVLGLADGIYKTQPEGLNIALIAPFIFDASVKQIFYALLNGHCLDIVPDEIKLSGRKLLEYYEAHKIDVSDGTPVHLEIILDELTLGNKRDLPGRFLIGGQQLMYQTVRKLFEIKKEGSPVITNVYGPTECCDVSTCLNIDHKKIIGSGSQTFNALPIGRPLNNVQVYILDSSLKKVPVGVNGELCIGGNGLARGYINRPELTEGKFIEVEGKRIYRTGDIGRYLPDGTILLSGRTDDQIKLRGFRIELSEIENCLRSFSKINQAAVIPVGLDSNKEIAAYYCSTEKIERHELERFLALHLPAYMIPSHFVELEQLPVTLNGKVDKRQLPIPLRQSSLTENAPAEPAGRDLLEEKLCTIWKDLLHLEYVNLSDNFFTLGGHSLIAIKLSSRIHREFNVELNIWEIFQNPSIELLAGLLRSKNPSLFTPIEKIEDKEYYPLSHAQRRLWFLSKLEGQSQVYNLPGALLLKGDVDVNVLEKVFQAIVDRHESFRTCFVEIDGEPYQKILPKAEITIERSQFEGGEWNENTLYELAGRYFEKEFNLSEVPLLDIKLIVLSEGKYLLLFNMHHIISDGWSIEVMVREIELYYNSFLNNTEADIKPLRIQYKDYAAWQNKVLEGNSLGGVKKYWLEKLSGPRAQLNLPADYSRTESYTIDGELQKYSLNDETVNALRKIAGDQNASLYMALLSAVYILFNKYTGQEDIMLGSPVAGRQHYDLEDQVGYYINTIVLRNRVEAEKTYRQLLSQVKETLSGAIDNQLYPFDRLVEELGVERIRNRNPLFDVMVAWMVKNGMNMKLNFGGIEAAGIDFRINKSMFDLTFLFDESEGNVSLTIEYNTSLFKRERIQRMAGHFKRLLESIISSPGEKIKNLEYISDGEKKILLPGELNQDSLPAKETNSAVKMFNLQAGVSKDKTALVYEEKNVTYGELSRLSNRIANHIIRYFAPEKDDVIAVVVDDPLLSVASMLAVMKTGAAYLPVISENPAERIAYIVADSRAKGILTDCKSLSSADDWPESSTIKDKMIINLSGSLCEDDSLPGVNPESSSLAYIIYTSGSTGQPKGVMIEHGALSNLISSLRQNVYSLYTGGLNELMISSFAFDVSIKQVFAALCSGNTLHLLSKDKRLDAREIIKYIIAGRINVIDVTPSLFSVMLEEGFAGMMKTDLREIFLGSEALPFRLIKTFYGFENNHSIKVTNFYGPTESCVESSCFRLHPDMVSENYDIVPIGKPILNEQMFILDRHLHLCPVGVPGEICIAGKGLAREYLNDPERTGEKFVHLPMLGGRRIYRTGDLGRMMSDGNIEFLGRMDEQVKLRGYRVELREIELQMRGVKEIKDCAVMLYESNGLSELAAYYTSEEIIDQAALKNYLSGFLPKYMIPSSFIRLDKIPLSANGKANKKLLPRPDETRRGIKIKEPKDEIELSVLRICKNILKKEEIGIEDNFFEIGGNSLSAVRLISRIQKELNVDLALKEIFYNPGLDHISEKVKALLLECRQSEENIGQEQVIVPASEDELNILSNLQFDDEE
ncbi:MAG TPA: amino acid adenylation domain-containing protein [Ignavibacteriales bacterium]|nr:amino acid adenylation domain-containing protein [Ignavibacteriales bacterium]